MPRYRVAFAREWTLGRWGYLDRFFHDLGGRQSERSGLENAWILEYRGQARHLGRELARALNIQEADFREFGPIFDIEELAQADRKPSSTEDAPQTEAAASGSAGRKEEASSAASHSTESDSGLPGEQQEGPSWVTNSEVEDVDLVGKEAEAEFDTMDAEATDGGATAAQARWDDLFRIRQRSNPSGRRRAEAIAGASRRRAPTGRPSSH